MGVGESSCAVRAWLPWDASFPCPLRELGPLGGAQGPAPPSPVVPHRLACRPGSPGANGNRIRCELWWGNCLLIGNKMHSAYPADTRGTNTQTVHVRFRELWVIPGLSPCTAASLPPQRV